MLTITKEQMIRADAKTRVHFHRRVREDLCEKMPEEIAAYPDSTLLAYIGEQDKIAGEHGIKTELGVTKWVYLSLGLGTDFYQKEPAKHYFSEQTSIDPETKVTLLGDYLHAKQKDPKVTIKSIFTKQGYHVMGS
jgi:hypothetical protein